MAPNDAADQFLGHSDQNHPIGFRPWRPVAQRFRLQVVGGGVKEAELPTLMRARNAPVFLKDLRVVRPPRILDLPAAHQLPLTGSRSCRQCIEQRYRPKLYRTYL